MLDEHEDRVATLGRCVGQFLGFEGQDLRRLELACAFHDVGKLAIPDHILLKPGKLTIDEFAIIKTHSIMGDQVMRALNRPELADIVRAHHERWDGMGYPDGLIGDEIPMESRIICAVDAYDAMTNYRVYKQTKMTPAEAIDELMRCAETQFDPACVGGMLKVLGR